jgi:glycosyltransferase involved in cell wall biosynthesis
VSAGVAATLLVTTRDRRDDLARLLTSVRRQTADAEVLVIDDGSTDGTAELVRREFPEVRLERSEASHGLIAQRNRGTDLARGPIVVSVDDDADLPSPDTVAQTLADFDHPRVAAVGIPFVDVPRGPDVQQRAPAADGVWAIPVFRGTAYAVRRDVFLAVGGFRESLQQVAEEMDFCLRLLDRGYVVRAGRADPLMHLESPRRSRPRIAYLDRRNNVLHAWRNVPMPYLPVRLAKIAAETPGLVRVHGHPGALARGLGAGLAHVARRGERDPVARSTYRANHALRRRGPARLETIEALLPAPEQR